MVRRPIDHTWSVGELVLVPELGLHLFCPHRFHILDDFHHAFAGDIFRGQFITELPHVLSEEVDGQVIEIRHPPLRPSLIHSTIPIVLVLDLVVGRTHASVHHLRLVVRDLHGATQHVGLEGMIRKDMDEDVSENW